MAAGSDQNQELAKSILTSIWHSNKDQIRRQPDTLIGLLNDKCPHLDKERLQLTSALNIKNFRSTLINNSVGQQDISRLEHDLDNYLGFKKRIAEWIAESWAFALEILDETESKLPQNGFHCPLCKRYGIASDEWKLKTLSCPQCNSCIDFSWKLEPSVSKIGWKKKRVDGGDWQLTKITRANNVIYENLQQLLHDEKLSKSERSSLIGLKSIVSSLTVETEAILESLGRKPSKKAVESLVLGVLRGNLNQSDLVLTDGSPSDQLTDLLNKVPENFTLNQKILGFINGVEELHNYNCVVFGVEKFFFINETLGWVRYEDIDSLTIKLGESIYEFCIGNERVINVRGLGVSRRDLIRTLKIICKSIRSFKEHQQLG